MALGQSHLSQQVTQWLSRRQSDLRQHKVGLMKIKDARFFNSCDRKKDPKNIKNNEKQNVPDRMAATFAFFLS